MPKSAEQKLKLIYLLNFLQDNTDEEHAVTMQQILDYLMQNGIKAERKSIYTDIEALNRLGYEIMYRKPEGYYLTGRELELPELKLLVDAVQSSKFISEKKSNELIGKLEKMTSRYEANKLQRQVFVAHRIKTDNEKTLYNIDDIYGAIASNRRISFKYCAWNLDKKLVYKHDGKPYRVDPVALIWDDENYYLVAKDVEAGIMKHYRVDKMREIQVLEEARDNSDNSARFDIAQYVKKHFFMYSGEETNVKIRFNNELIGAIIDRFGKDIMVIKGNDGTSHARVNVVVSDLFFGWISGFGGRIRIVEPENIRQQYMTFIEDIRQTF